MNRLPLPLSFPSEIQFAVAARRQLIAHRGVLHVHCLISKFVEICWDDSVLPFTSRYAVDTCRFRIFKKHAHTYIITSSENSQKTYIFTPIFPKGSLDIHETSA